ncbi:MAG: glycosyltransferase [Cetobacterium sp.]|uniref:glycosyltransferase n=1 Tax=Cetobacterium sp. TaxID=2071632 RepID=UPI003F3FBE55
MDLELSIIVPIYNVEIYLRECLDSLYSIRNIKKEIILVNDGSTDDSLRIIKEYKKKYSDETVIIDKENRGLSSARNAGLDVAKGKYISFIDSDDFINPERYEDFFLKGKKMELDIIVGTAIKYRNGDLEEFYRDNNLIDEGIITGSDFLDISFKTNSYRAEVVDDIYLSSLIKDNKIKFKENLLHEDELFTPQVFSEAKRVKLINKTFYYYRQRTGSIMYTKSLRNAFSRFYIVEKLIDLNKIKIKSKYMNNNIYRIYSNTVSLYKVLPLSQHIYLFLFLKIGFKDRLWFLKIFKYLKVIKIIKNKKDYNYKRVIYDKN